MKSIDTKLTDPAGNLHFTLSHEDALATQVAIQAVYSQLVDEERWRLASVLQPIMDTLYEYLYPDEKER